MILDEVPGGTRYLSYCTNVHPGETIQEITADLRRTALPLKRRLAPNEPFALGLRLGEIAVSELDGDPRAFSEFEAFLGAEELLAYTLNVFPQQRFHQHAAKSAVYEPDWSQASRFDYTLAAARLLARLLPSSASFGTLSTLPLGAVGTPELLRRAAGQLSKLAHELAILEENTGQHILVCLEPEPLCALETVRETVEFYNTVLLPHTAGLAAVGSLNGEAQVRRHLGVCLDICHLAVEFEDPCYSLERLARQGITVGKIQLSAALSLARPAENKEGLAELAAFAEPRFFHQVVVRDRLQGLHRFQDLPEFLNAAREAPEGWMEARCHFHVPIHALPPFPLTSTRDCLLQAIHRQRGHPEVLHLEVETYTFDVLPRAHTRTVSLEESLEAELRFARDQLLGPAGE